MIRYKETFLHYNFVSTLLNDLFGIQVRGGCACAGPYVIIQTFFAFIFTQNFLKY